MGAGRAVSSWPSRPPTSLPQPAKASMHIAKASVNSFNERWNIQTFAWKNKHISNCITFTNREENPPSYFDLGLAEYGE